MDNGHTPSCLIMTKVPYFLRRGDAGDLLLSGTTFTNLVNGESLTSVDQPVRDVLMAGAIMVEGDLSFELNRYFMYVLLTAKEGKDVRLHKLLYLSMVDDTGLASTHHAYFCVKTHPSISIALYNRMELEIDTINRDYKYPRMLCSCPGSVLQRSTLIDIGLPWLSRLIGPKQRLGYLHSDYVHFVEYCEFMGLDMMEDSSIYAEPEKDGAPFLTYYHLSDKVVSGGSVATVNNLRSPYWTPANDTTPELFLHFYVDADDLKMILERWNHVNASFFKAFTDNDRVDFETPFVPLCLVTLASVEIPVSLDEDGVPTMEGFSLVRGRRYKKEPYGRYTLHYFSYIYVKTRP